MPRSRNARLSRMVSEVFVPWISSEITFENSVPIFSGSTRDTTPFVASLSFPRFFMLHFWSPFIVNTEIETPFSAANFPTSSQKPDSDPSGFIEPSPRLASPSVQIITFDPGFPLAAIATEARSAGPSAVEPNVVISETFRRMFSYESYGSGDENI